MSCSHSVSETRDSGSGARTIGNVPCGAGVSPVSERLDQVTEHHLTSKGEPKRLRTHEIILADGPVLLRPMTETDWDLLLRWNNDPEVLYFSEGDDRTHWPLDDLQDMYRGVSAHALMFIMEIDGQPIGDCWLQEMNIQRILDRYPGQRLHRFPIFIGEKRFWAQGWGTRAIALLARHAFEHCAADAVFAMGVADYNPRSRRAFEKNGFVIDQQLALPPGGKASVEYDLKLTRERFLGCLRSPACRRPPRVISFYITMEVPRCQHPSQ